MKITKRDLLVLLYIISVVGLIAVYNFVVSPKMEEIDAVNIENEGLETKVKELEEKVERKGELESQIVSMESEISVITSDYPEGITKEDIVLYVNELNDNVDMNITSVSFSEPSIIYSVVGNGDAAKYDMSLQQIQVTVDYMTDYDGFKQIVNYINDDPEHREIDSVDVSITEETKEENENNENREETATAEPAETEQVISGSFTILLYFIDGKLTDTEPDSRYDVVDVQHGMQNIYKGQERD